MRSLLFALLLALAGGVSDEFDRKILADLEAQSPQAVPLWNQANQARAAGDYAKASQLYARVRELAPGFVHATRRQCSAEQMLGHREQALALCKQALVAEESAENLASLASVLGSGEPGRKAPPADVASALTLAERATRLRDDANSETTLCQVALTADDLTHFRSCTGRLQVLAPADLVTHFFAYLLALHDERWSDARAELERAHGLGLPEEGYRQLRASLDEHEPWYSRYWPAGKLGGAVWLSAMVLLVVAGFLLSRAALAASRRVPTSPTGHAHGVDAALRRLYRVVLWLCCGYYYVSMPIVLLAVVAAGGGVIYACFAIGHIPIKLVVVVGILTLVTISAVLKALFVRGKDEDPGLRLDLSQHPKLRALLDDVAAHVGTRAVDNVYLTPGTEVAVTERGGLARQLRGAQERCLILGVAVLEGFQVGDFKAVLAHEYGHFSNADTAGGGFAIAVRRSLMTLAINLARGGAATWYNPAWWFVSGFYRVFLRISQGASRLQEVLADRWAAFTYGSERFVRGLKHVIERSVRFDAHVQATLEEVVEGQRALANLYAYQPTRATADGDIEQKVQAALSAPASPYDSHPAPADRIAWVTALGASGQGSAPGDQASSWSLLEGREGLERMMTEKVRMNLLLQHNIMIRDVAPADAAAG